MLKFTNAFTFPVEAWEIYESQVTCEKHNSEIQTAV